MHTLADTSLSLCPHFRHPLRAGYGQKGGDYDQSGGGGGGSESLSVALSHIMTVYHNLRSWEMECMEG